MDTELLTMTEPSAPLTIARTDFRHRCGRLLFRGVLPVGTYISIVCPRCGKMAVFDLRLERHIGNGNGESDAHDPLA